MESVGNLKVPLTIPAARSIQAQCQRNIEFIAAVLSMAFSAWQTKRESRKPRKKRRIGHVGEENGLADPGS